MIKDFQTFLNENKGDLRKVIMTVSTALSDFEFVTNKDTAAKNYFQIFTKGDKPFKTDMPVINFCNIHTQKLLDAGTPKDLIYNPKEKKMEIASKVKWHETHKDSKHVPKTVSEPEDLDQLKFPIIAKPDNRYSGMGIQKFDTLEDAQKSNLDDFEIFSEKIDIAEEHRITMWKGEPQSWFHRVPADDKTKNMDKSTDAKLHFNYVLKDVDNMPKEWQPVFDEFTEAHKGLDIYSVDLMVDTDGKPWVVEMSSEFMPIYGVMAYFYKKVYQDYYGNKLSPADEKELDKYHQQDIEYTVNSDKKRFSVE